MEDAVLPTRANAEKFVRAHAIHFSVGEVNEIFATPLPDSVAKHKGRLIFAIIPVKE